MVGERGGGKGQVGGEGRWVERNEGGLLNLEGKHSGGGTGGLEGAAPHSGCQTCNHCG